MNTSKMPASPCPVCGTKNNMATDPFSNETPSPDDFTVCTECGALARFNADMSLRPATGNDLHDLSMEALLKLAAVRMAVLNLKQARQTHVDN